MTEGQKIGIIITKFINIGIFLRENGFPEEAITCFEILSIDDPSYETGDFAFEIALCYLKLKKYDEAHKYFNISISENPYFYEDKINSIFNMESKQPIDRKY